MWFNDNKGYGFISPNEGGEDLFVHHSGIAGNGFKSLDEGAKVSYEATQGNKGITVYAPKHTMTCKKSRWARSTLGAPVAS